MLKAALLFAAFFLVVAGVWVFAVDSNSQVLDANSLRVPARDSNSAGARQGDANAGIAGGQAADTNVVVPHDANSGAGAVAPVDSNAHSGAVPPVTAIAVSPGADGNSASFTLSCTASAGSACAFTKYSLDTNSQGGTSFGPFVVYSSPVTVAGDGNWGVRYFSQDSNGNAGAGMDFYIIVPVKAAAAPELNPVQDLNMGNGLNSVAGRNTGLDLNRPMDLNGSVDLNRALDFNSASGLNGRQGPDSLHDLNSVDRNSGLDTNSAGPGRAVAGAAITIPDFNFFRVGGPAGGLYLASFDIGFLAKMKGFADALFASLSSSDANPHVPRPVPDFNGLYIVPDANYFSSLDTNSPQALGFVTGIKSALDSFLQGTALPPRPAGRVRETVVTINGRAVKCFGKCDSVPVVVR